MCFCPRVTLARTEPHAVGGNRSLNLIRKLNHKLQLDDDLKAAKKMRLSLRGKVYVFVATLIIGLLFAYFGRFDLARPSLFSAGMLVLAFTIERKFDRHPWFWITMVIIATLHVLLIWSVNWTSKWVPAVTMAGLGTVDLYLILVILAIVRRCVEGPSTRDATGRPSSRRSTASESKAAS